jgi:hypothetical protein
MFEFNGDNRENVNVAGWKWKGGSFDGDRGPVAGVTHIFYLNISAQDVSIDSEFFNEIGEVEITQVGDSAIYVDCFNDDTRTSTYSSGEWRFYEIDQRKSGTGIELKGLSEVKIWDSEFSGDTAAIELVGCGPVEIDNTYTNGGNILDTVTSLVWEGGFHDTTADKPWALGKALRYSKITGQLIRVVGSSANTIHDVVRLESSSGIHSIYNTIGDMTAGRFQGSGTNKYACFINETDANQNWNNYYDLTIAQTGDFASTQLFNIMGPNSKVHTAYTTTSGRYSGSEALYGTYIADADDDAYFQWQIPEQFNQIVSVRIWGYTYINDVNGGMTLNITMVGAAESEPVATHSISLLNFVSHTNPLTLGDKIYWEFDGSDDADVWALLTGDSISVKIEIGEAVGDHSATEAAITGIEWRYL